MTNKGGQHGQLHAGQTHAGQDLVGIDRLRILAKHGAVVAVNATGNAAALLSWQPEAMQGVVRHVPSV